MRKLLLIFLSLMLMSGSCRKPKSKTPIEQLPAETQTGANTFGCLINGKGFIPKGDPFGGPIMKSAYQFVSGKYSLIISGTNSSSSIVKGVGIQGEGILLRVGSYELAEYAMDGKLSGSYAEFESANVNDYYTNNNHRGQFTVTRFDSVNQIISGTFWFDAKNKDGKIVQVREGRFDMPYVK